jgi:hypothetical protein
MKKVNLKGKFSLNKETISNLDHGQMGNVLGGDIPATSPLRNTCYNTCNCLTIKGCPSATITIG